MYVTYLIDILPIFLTCLFIAGKCNTQLENGLCIYRKYSINPPGGGLIISSMFEEWLIRGGGISLVTVVIIYTVHHFY